MFGAIIDLDGKKLDAGSPSDLALLRQKVGRGNRVVLEPDEDTYLAQAALLLALLEDSGAEIWLKAREPGLGFRVRLRDETEFRAWLDEAKPGKVRVIQRADGLEIQTNIGKMPGADPNGPTLPARSGRQDIPRLRTALQRLQQRFDTVRDACVVPSFGMPLGQVAELLTGFYEGPSAPIFSEICLVYPRSAAPAP